MAKDPVVTKVKARHPRGDGSATGNESPPDQQSRPTLDTKAYERELARLQIELVEAAGVGASPGPASWP